MKTHLSVATLAALASLALLPASSFAQGTAFTYQGRLTDQGAPAAGFYDLQFKAWDAPTNGNLVAGPVTNATTGVTNGLFTVTLDLGGVFTGSNLWLEIAVRTNGTGVFNTLSPRQPITPAPYAIYSASAGSANSVSAANLVGVVPAANIPPLNYATTNQLTAATNSAAETAASLVQSALYALSPLAFTNKYQLAGWWDATQPQTPADGTPQIIPDLSGNSRNATNSDVSRQPVWHQFWQDDLPAYVFNGSNGIAITPPFIDTSYNSNFTVFIVASKLTTANGSYVGMGDWKNWGYGTNIFSIGVVGGEFEASPNGFASSSQWLFASRTITNTEPVVLSFIASTTNLQFFVNGCQASSDYGSGLYASVNYPYNWPRNYLNFGSNVFAPAAFGGVANNGGINGGTVCDEVLREAILFKGALSRQEHDALIKNYLAPKWRVAQSHIVFVGDSITEAYAVANNGSYPGQTMQLLHSGVPTWRAKWTAEDIGQNGATVSMVAPPYYQAQPGGYKTAPFYWLGQARTVNDIASIFYGANDLDINPGDTNDFYTNLVALCCDARRSGYKVIVASVLPRTLLKLASTNQFELARLGANSLVRANWKTFADGFADHGADPVMGNFANITNTLYYADGVHPTVLGYSYLATNVYQAILDLTVNTAATNQPGQVVFTNSANLFTGTFSGSGAGLTNLPAGAITGGLTTNVPVPVPGGGTNLLCFTNGVLMLIR